MDNLSSSSFSESDKFPFEELTSLVRSGATSDCYKVKMWGRWFFLKRPKKEFCDDPLYVSAFEKEFSVGVLLDNDHIVRYHSIGHDDDGVFILTDYVEGVTLTEYVQKEGPLSRKEIRRISLQVADALGYLHSKGFVHGDLKPDNILIRRENGDVKIVDLGFSYGDCYDMIGKGSGGFSAPEQLHGEKADFRADIYSLGKVMSFMGKPFHKVAAKASKEDPSQRYQDVRDIVKALTPSAYIKYIPAIILTLAACALMVISLHKKETINSIETIEPIVQEAVKVQFDSQPKSVEERFRENLDSIFSAMFNPFYEKYPTVNDGNFVASRSEMQSLMMGAIQKGNELKERYKKDNPEADPSSFDGIIRSTVDKFTYRYAEQCAMLGSGM